MAELGAAFACGSIGFDWLYDAHAHYLDSWLAILKSDSRAIFRAAAMAQKSADFILKTSTKEEVFTEAVA